jgi:hypothetical protein
MNAWGKFDQDAVLRARVALLASGRRTVREEVDAYRVLAQVSPAAYLPKLVRALQGLSFDHRFQDRPEIQWTLREEALAAARTVDPSEPAWEDLVHRSLAYAQRPLFALGRRSEGLALRAEMLAMDRAKAKRTGSPRVGGLPLWAAGVAEEGRHDEAAEAMAEWVAAMRPDGLRHGELAAGFVQWIGALDAAGRSGEALAAYGELVDAQRAGVGQGDVSLGDRLHTLIGHARMLDARERDERATAARREALAVFVELAATGERTGWNDDYQVAYWAVLQSCSRVDGERATRAVPRPAAGARQQDWSADARRHYADSLDPLRNERDVLTPRAAEDPDRFLAELVRVHHTLTLRSVVLAGDRWYRLPERVCSLFDEGVELARRLHRHQPADGTRVLADRLVDRAAYRVVAREYAPALDDFREALHLLGEMRVS